MTARVPETTAPDRPSGRTPRRIALVTGPAAAVVFVGGIFLAAYAFTPTSSFSWTGDVDQFGILRHYSIALGSLLGFVFLWPAWTDATNTIQRAGLGVFGVAFLNEAVANGVATAGVHVGDWHVLGLLFLFPIALFLYGGGDVYAGRRRRGGASLLLAGLYALNVWLLLPLPPAPEGYGLIGYVGSFVLVAAWISATYLSLRA